MAKIIGIMGESGSGKTTSMRNLDPKTTMYVDCDKKGLAWPKWRESFGGKNKNYVVTDDPKIVLQTLVSVEKMESFKHIKTVVIDTLNGVMVADEMRRMNEKNYDKWMDLAASVYNLIDFALTMRDDVTIIFVAHSQTDRDDSGYTWTRIKTSGKKLDKICLESKFPVVLLAKCIDGKYVFETHSNFSTAKTPMGAFETETIDNDIVKVIDALKDF